MFISFTCSFLRKTQSVWQQYHRYSISYDLNFHFHLGCPKMMNASEILWIIWLKSGCIKTILFVNVIFYVNSSSHCKCWFEFLVISLLLDWIFLQTDWFIFLWIIKIHKRVVILLRSKLSCMNKKAHFFLTSISVWLLNQVGNDKRQKTSKSSIVTLQVGICWQIFHIFSRLGVIFAHLKPLQH